MRLLSFGEVLWDLINEEAHLGGAPLNFAAHSVQCGAGATAILSRIGKDKHGDEARKRMIELGVDVNLLQTDPEKPTGTVPVTLVEGQPDYYITPDVAFDYIDYALAREVLKKKRFDVLYFGTLAQRGPSAGTLRNVLNDFDFSLKFYDVNLRKDCYSEEIIRFSLGQANLVKLNEDEAAEIGKMLFGKGLSLQGLVRELQREFTSLDHVIITAGGQGCYVSDKDTLHHIRAEPIRVVDAIGAGDSFSAAFLHSFFRSGNVLKAARIGNQVGGFVASSSGAIPLYNDEIKSLLEL